MMSELKPCPFCGGEAELYTSNVSALVECNYCGACIGACVGHNAKANAIKAWNKRHNEPLQDGKESNHES